MARSFCVPLGLSGIACRCLARKRHVPLRVSTHVIVEQCAVSPSRDEPDDILAEGLADFRCPWTPITPPFTTGSHSTTTSRNSANVAWVTDAGFQSRLSDYAAGDVASRWPCHRPSLFDDTSAVSTGTIEPIYLQVPSVNSS